MKEILLVNPYSGMRREDNIPVSILSLGSYLTEHGYSVKIFDGFAKTDYIEDVEKHVKDAFAIGMSLMSVQLLDGLKIMKMAKRINPNIHIIVGGVHPTMFPDHTTKHPLVDFVIRGEGEETLLELLKKLEKKSQDLSSVKSLTYMKGNRVVSNPDRSLLDMNKLPLLNWDLVYKDVLEKYTKSYKTLNYTWYLPLPVQTSRGCPHRCTFCYNVCTGNLWNRWRSKNPDKVIEELNVAINKLGAGRVYFRDEIFFVNKNRVQGILDGIKKEKLDFQWITNARVDYFAKGIIDRPLLRDMKKTGVKELYFGVESGSPRILEKLKKDITIDQVIMVAKILKEFKIKSAYSFMTGIPGETKEDVKMTLNLIKKIKTINSYTEIYGPQPFRPYPGGELYEEIQTLGYTVPDDLDGWANMFKDEVLRMQGVSNDFPWIENIEFTENIWPLVRNATYDSASLIISTIRRKDFAKLPIQLFMISMAKFRWSTNKFDSFFEQRVEKSYLNLMDKLRLSR